MEPLIMKPKCTTELCINMIARTRYNLPNSGPTCPSADLDGCPIASIWGVGELRVLLKKRKDKSAAEPRVSLRSRRGKDCERKCSGGRVGRSLFPGLKPPRRCSSILCRERSWFLITKELHIWTSEPMPWWARAKRWDEMIQKQASCLEHGQCIIFQLWTL